MKREKVKNRNSKPDKKISGLESNKAITDRSEYAFDKENYKWLLIGLAFLLVGYLLMIGGGSDDPDVFNYGMFNFQRLTLSPILIMIGYLIGIYSIMKKPKSSDNQQN